jgi:beta-galactosidase
MVPHVRPEDSRSWKEVKRLGAELGKLDDLLGARGEARTAILLDWENWWAMELDSKPSADVRMLEGFYTFYKPLFEANIPVDFAHPGADLSSYELLLAPQLYLVRDEAAENIRRFVAEGGTLVMSFFSGIVDERDHIRLGGYPAPFREMLGLLVEDFVPISAGEENSILAHDSASYSCDFWADLVHLEGAESLASYERDFYAGTPAVTRHVFGNGVAYYLGTRPEEGYTKLLLEKIRDETGVRPPLEAPPGVEVVRRKSEKASFLFVLNHKSESTEVRIDGLARSLLSGEEHDRVLRLEPLDVAILEEAGE